VSAGADSDREALARLAALGRAASGAIPLAETALLLGSLDLDRSPAAMADCRAILNTLADDLSACASSAKSLVERAEALAAVIAGRHGFTGDRETYDDLANANLIAVLERRRGLPVALAILYIHAARAVGWEMDGLNFPGRFLVRLGAPDGRAVIDPFDGGVTREASSLRELLKQSVGSLAELAPEHFAAVEDRDILLRLQNNIKVRLLQADRITEALVIIERMQLIAPAEPMLWLEAGGYHARLGNLRAAIEAAERCGGLASDEGLRQRAASLLQELKGRLH
jgi:regulator of sirC expression with transglutaminase-like and TPR domain